MGILLAACLIFTLTLSPEAASTIIDGHSSEVELDDTLEAYSEANLVGAEDPPFNTAAYSSCWAGYILR